MSLAHKTKQLYMSNCSLQLIFAVSILMYGKCIEEEKISTLTEFLEQYQLNYTLVNHVNVNFYIGALNLYLINMHVNNAFRNTFASQFGF